MSTAPWQRPWIKLWVETLSDPKVVDALEPAQRWVWLALLMATAKSPEAGVMLLPSGRPMSVRQIWQATRSTDMGLDEFQVALSLMEEQQMIRWREDKALIIVNWHERQDPQTPAQRMRRYRSKKTSNGSGDVTSTVTERHGESLREPLRGVTPSVTDPLRKVTQEGKRGRGEEGQRIRSEDSDSRLLESGDAAEPTSRPENTLTSFQEWSERITSSANGREAIGTLADFARLQYPRDAQGGSLGPSLDDLCSNIGGLLTESNLDGTDLLKVMWRSASYDTDDFMAYVRGVIKHQEERYGGKQAGEQRAAGDAGDWSGLPVDAAEEATGDP